MVIPEACVNEIQKPPSPKPLTKPLAKLPIFPQGININKTEKKEEKKEEEKEKGESEVEDDFVHLGPKPPPQSISLLSG